MPEHFQPFQPIPPGQGLTPLEPRNPATYLEPRLSEANFRRYEACIAHLVKHFPVETKFERPSDRTMNYYLGRFRDAIRSYIEYNWASDTIDREKLVGIRQKFVLTPSEDGRFVFCGQKVKRGKPEYSYAHTPVFETPPVEISPKWLEYTPPEVEALCRLLSAGKASGVVILVGQLEPTFAAHLQENFPTIVTYNSQRNETTIA